MAPGTAKGRWGGLGIRLFVSYLVVVLVGVATLLLAADLLSPTFFSGEMARMMAGGGMQRMMGGGGLATQQPRLEELNASLNGAFRASLMQGLLIAGVAAIAAAVVASLLVANRIVEPVKRLVQASQRLAAGHYAERVPAAGNDELAELAARFNDMAAALESTERRRLELIGDVAHELRTPVATLQGTLEGLLDGVIQPSQVTWGRLHDETGRLRRLIDDLQELSRAEAKQIGLHPQSVSPGDIVRAAVERLRPQFEEKGLSLSVEMPQRLPAAWADRDRSVQVLSNLLSNALRYTPAPGSVVVRAQASKSGVQFTVADSGVGLSQDQLAQVFERFYRADKSRSRALGGSGVGLTIARALVDAMGGRIWAESEGPAQGATFGFTLPAARARVAVA